MKNSTTKNILRIKNEIDLKDLEKLGFKYRAENYNTREHYAYEIEHSRITTELCAWVDCEDRCIHRGTYGDDNMYAVIIFRLTQANLVEEAEYDNT